jgi:hypothetical protein
MEFLDNSLNEEELRYFSFANSEAGNGGARGGNPITK